MKVPAFILNRTRKWNRVLDFAMNPCNATISVYVESMLPAAGKGIITLLSFGLDDVYRGMFRPKGLYPQHHLGRKKRSKSKITIPEIGEEIGKRLPAADKIKSRTFGTLEKYLWLADGVSQRALFYVMAFDVITDFAYDSMTGIYKREFCDKTDTSQYLAENQQWVVEPFPGPHWTLQFFDNPKFFIEMLAGQPVWAIRPLTLKNYLAIATWKLTTGAIASMETDITLGSNVPPRLHVEHVSMGPLESREFTLTIEGPLQDAATFPSNLTGFGPRFATCTAFQLIAK